MTTLSVIFEHRSGSAPQPVPCLSSKHIDRDISVCGFPFLTPPHPPERAGTARPGDGAVESTRLSAQAKSAVNLSLFTLPARSGHWLRAQKIPGVRTSKT